MKVYHHYDIDGYPGNLAHVVSDEGYGKNDYIETSRELVVVTAPGPGSGKLATCLSQLYHEHKRGNRAGYAKFETFPIWNLPLNHPVNLAYEAATADLNDVNMIDPFHLEAYGITTVNYNRDVEAFPVLETMFRQILGECPYKSPTDMGVNMAGNCITDDAVCREASRQEIIRRYYTALCEAKQGKGTEDAVRKLELLMRKAGTEPSARKVVAAALKRAEETGQACGGYGAARRAHRHRQDFRPLRRFGGSAAECPEGHCRGAGGRTVIAPEAIDPIQHLKVEHLGHRNPRLHTNEVLIALSGSAMRNEAAEAAMEALSSLRGCEVHSSVILSQVDEQTFKRLGVNLTCGSSTRVKCTN